MRGRIIPTTAESHVALLQHPPPRLRGHLSKDATIPRARNILGLGNVLYVNPEQVTDLSLAGTRAGKLNGIQPHLHQENPEIHMWPNGANKPLFN